MKYKRKEGSIYRLKGLTSKFDNYIINIKKVTVKMKDLDSIDYIEELLELHQFDEAEALLIKALAVRKDSDILNFKLAVLYEDFFLDLSQAEIYYKKAIGLNPTFIDAYTKLIELQVKLEKEDESTLSLCKTVYQLEPKNARHLNNLGY